MKVIKPEDRKKHIIKDLEGKSIGVRYTTDNPTDEKDRCSECGEVITQDDYITESDGMVDCGGAMVPMPEIVTGYECPKCGHKGRF